MGSRPVRVCGDCGAKNKSLRDLVCGTCGSGFQERIDAHVKKHREKVKAKALRQTDIFLEDFDGYYFDFSMRTLKHLESVTITQLVELFRREPIWFHWLKNFAAKMQLKEGPLGDLGEGSSWLDHYFRQFVRKRTIGMAKWWAREGAAFIGTDTTQGHCYRIYLKDPAPGGIKTLPADQISPKAVWSIERIQRKIKKKESDTPTEDS